MTDSNCNIHGCELTGIGSLSFCPQCQKEIDAGKKKRYYGYFADLLTVAGNLRFNADGLEIFADLEFLKQNVENIIKIAKTNTPNLDVKVSIYQAKRLDGQEIEFEENPFGDGGEMVESVVVFAGFKGCGRIKPQWVINEPRIKDAEFDDDPVLIVDSTKIT